MTLCKCGCEKPVKEGNRYFGVGCWRRGQARSYAKCRTCPGRLTGKDVARGCKRCETCRSKAGRSYAKRSPGLTNVETLNPNTINIKGAKPAPRADSWWTRPNLTREEFSQLSKQVVSIDTGIRFASGANGEAW